jgi:hypothetical protein
VAATIVLGLATGALLDGLTFLVARYGPAADGWSLRGNGALAVPLGIGPALVAAGWTILVARFRALRRWLALGLAGGLVGVVLVALAILSIGLGGQAAVVVSSVIGGLVLLWVFLAPLATALLPNPEPGPRTGLAAHLAAAISLPVTMTVAFLGSAALLPPGS